MTEQVDREKVLEEANELGLEFGKNTSTKKLIAMIAEAKGEPVPLDEESVVPSPEVKKETTQEAAENTAEERVSSGSVLSRAEVRRNNIAKRKKEALKTAVVTITNKDNRENSFTTTVPLTVENQYFSIGRIVPLDIPVELPQCLIDLAESTMMTLHKDEIIDGKRTGNKVSQSVKKFAISYAKQ